MANQKGTGTDSGGFDGFPQEALDFLATLGRKDKAWFDKNKKPYNELVVGPTKAFVVALGDQLVAKVSPAIEALPKTNGSISPINNDLRFSPDKSPYKDHVLLRFWEGPNKKTAPTLFVRISPDGLGFASGAMLPDIETWRAAVADDATGALLTAALKKLSKGREVDIDGQGYKKVPAPYAADHDRADLLRHKGAFQARWMEPNPAAIGSAAFVGFCVKRLVAAAPVHQWLLANL